MLLYNCSFHFGCIPPNKWTIIKLKGKVYTSLTDVQSGLRAGRVCIASARNAAHYTLEFCAS